MFRKKKFILHVKDMNKNPLYITSVDTIKALNKICYFQYGCDIDQYYSSGKDPAFQIGLVDPSGNNPVFQKFIAMPLNTGLCLIRSYA